MANSIYGIEMDKGYFPVHMNSPKNFHPIQYRKDRDKNHQHPGSSFLAVKNPELPIEQWAVTEHQVLTELYTITRELGGTISGEHGIGCKRREFVHLVMSEVEIDLQRRIKAAFDPNNILNPGKIFPEAALLKE